MRRVLTRLRAILVGLGVLAASATIAVATPTPAQAAGCTAPQVAVVVTFTHWGQSSRVGCVAWHSGLTGVQALQGAGFAITGTKQYGTSFICRINGLPDAGHESCNSTPSATAYWAYWHADPGQSSWSYSTLGAGTYHPHPGSAEGWAFGNGAAPAVSPGAVLPQPGGRSTTSPRTTGPGRTAPSTRPPSTRPPSTSHPSGPGPTRPRTTADPGPSTGPGSSQTTGPTAASPTSGQASTSGAPVTSASTSPGTTGAAGDASGSSGSAPTQPGGSAAGASTPSLVPNGSSPAAARHQAHGSPWPTVLAIVLVALLAAGAGGYALRRRAGRAHL